MQRGLRSLRGNSWADDSRQERNDAHDRIVGLLKRHARETEGPHIALRGDIRVLDG